jgi:hypothetical protein
MPPLASILYGLRGLILGGLLLGSTSVMAQTSDTPDLTLYLIGDGGAAYSVEGTPALAMLRDSLEACPGTCSVLFLGDNIYESGLAPPDHPDRARGEQILDTLRSKSATRGHPATWSSCPAIMTVEVSALEATSSG